MPSQEPTGLPLIQFPCAQPEQVERQRRGSCKPWLYSSVPQLATINSTGIVEDHQQTNRDDRNKKQIDNLSDRGTRGMG